MVHLVLIDRGVESAGRAATVVLKLRLGGWLRPRTIHVPDSGSRSKLIAMLVAMGVSPL